MKYNISSVIPLSSFVTVSSSFWILYSSLGMYILCFVLWFLYSSIHTFLSMVIKKKKKKIFNFVNEGFFTRQCARPNIRNGLNTKAAMFAAGSLGRTWCEECDCGTNLPTPGPNPTPLRKKSRVVRDANTDLILNCV